MRSRAWRFIGYPESLPENYDEILDDAMVEWARSPLHDRDTLEDGSQKKPHYHFFIYYDQAKSLAQVKSLVQDLLHSPLPLTCDNKPHYFRYFLHLDHPHKAQYIDREDEIINQTHFDLAQMLAGTAEDQRNDLKEIFDMIVNNQITEFYELSMLITHEEHDMGWWYLYNQHTSKIRTFIDSYRNSLQQHGDYKPEKDYHFVESKKEAPVCDVLVELQKLL